MSIDRDRLSRYIFNGISVLSLLISFWSISLSVSIYNTVVELLTELQNVR